MVTCPKCGATPTEGAPNCPKCGLATDKMDAFARKLDADVPSVVRAAWDALPESQRARTRGRIAEHSVFHSRAKLGFTAFSDEERQAMPPVPQALVRVVPESGRTSLYLSSHMARILDLPDDEGRALLDALVDHATQRRFVYTHRWRVNDLVMWDDRCTMHRGTDFDDLRFRRDMQRATVRDIANTCEQEGLAIGR